MASVYNTRENSAMLKRTMIAFLVWIRSARRTLHYHCGCYLGGTKTTASLYDTQGCCRYLAVDLATGHLLSLIIIYKNTVWPEVSVTLSSKGQLEVDCAGFNDPAICCLNPDSWLNWHFQWKDHWDRRAWRQPFKLTTQPGWLPAKRAWLRVLESLHWQHHIIALHHTIYPCTL